MLFLNSSHFRFSKCIDFAISEFTQFSHCGHRLAVICKNGLFLWELRPNQGSYTFRGQLARTGSKLKGQSMNRVVFSPCDKYVALHQTGGRTVEIYDVYSNTKVYRHQIWHPIRQIEWIPSTKENRYCPLRLLMATESPYILMLNLLTFETQSFQCKLSQSERLRESLSALQIHCNLFHNLHSVFYSLFFSL